ncbi:hypothetical protein [Polyangium aurulentum]|uniref:hypothetical protein n=1 Tax=Polyangium aurulentum TaxID=2567896 RepID=UPI0010AED437|nr:hypothetical protein [Polyangium aurulentum]UQA62169.1 hypothetical protein E8A73_017555 [Polyangium aurulentum]
MDLPPHEIDRRIARAVREQRRAERAARESGQPGRASVLEAHRAVSSRSMWVELGERATDPVLSAAQAWVYALTIDRVVWPARARVVEAWHAPSIEMEEPKPERLSPRTVRARLLAEATPERRHLLASALTDGAGPLADAVRIADERRAEAIRRLGVDDADVIEIPIDPPAALASAAERLLERTAELMPPRPGRWDDAIATSLARDAGEGWPARLGVRWFDELFRKTGLLDGLAPEMDPLPEPLGAASFARALAVFGGAWAEADVPRSAPFSLARPPFDLRRHRRAALFGALAADPMFLGRVLGLGRDRARRQAQEVARALLLTLRLDAARVLLRKSVMLSHAARAERHEELTDRALGSPVPGRLAGVVPTLSATDAARFAGALLSSTDRRSLVERFDEDWFRSPHAARALREEQGVLPASPRVAAAAIDTGLDDLVRALSELFR